MATINEDADGVETKGFRARSNLADDVWHDDAGAAPYEWWYFDAMSDDGRDTVVIIFLANFIFSPRYNRAAASAARSSSSVVNTASTFAAQFPAVAFCLYRDGRPIVRAINEYTRDDFTADSRRPACRIGRSSFQLEEGAQGSSFRITLDEALRGRGKLFADFSFQIIEGDLEGEQKTRAPLSAATHDWNLVAPRCRVTGTYNFDAGRAAARAPVAQSFQGTGYHDHNHDRRWLPATVAEWQWGRAHFDDATAIFYRYREHTDADAVSRLFVVRDGSLVAYDAVHAADEIARDRFGLAYPRIINFVSEAKGGNVTLHVSQQRVIDRSFFYLRLLGDASLDMDGRTRRARALTERLAPRSLRWRWLDWLTDMRIGRNGKQAFLK